MIIMILVARTLGPESYGFLSIFFTTGFILSSIVNSLKTAFVRKNSKKMNSQMARLCFWIELVVALIVVFSGIIILYSISGFLVQGFHKAIFYGLIYGLTTTLSWAVLGVLEAKQSFKRLAYFTIFESLARVLIISLLFLNQKLTITNTYLVFIIIGSVGFVVSFFLIDIKMTGKLASWKSFKPLLKFAKWMILINIIIIFSRSIDIFIASYFSPMYEVGIYSAGKSFASKILIIVNSIIFVLFPKLSSLHKSEIKPYLKKVFRHSLLFIVIFFPGIFFSKFLIMITYGQSFLRTIPFFNVFYITFLISIIVSILFVINYVIDKPQITFFLALFNLVILIVAGMLCVPVFGLISLAYIMLFNVIVNLIINGVILIKKLS
ncbi:MAG: oligosaccharide flippase family protein [Nanoarchaeota archaeon]